MTRNMARSFKIAMGQMLVEGGMPSRNLARARDMIREAKGADLVLLPECLDLGWTHPSAKELAQPIPGAYSRLLCQTAEEEGIYVVAGITERWRGRIYNSAILISPTGRILLKYRKINELAIAQDIYSPGDRLGVARTCYGTIGINICADNFPDSLVIGHCLARMGAEVILSPSAWAVDADHDNQKQPYGEMWEKTYSFLAQLYDISIIGVSNVGWITAGVWAGKKCIGCSLAVNHRGEVIARGPYGEDAEALIIVEIEVLPRKAWGTAISEMLKRKGYYGVSESGGWGL